MSEIQIGQVWNDKGGGKWTCSADSMYSRVRIESIRDGVVVFRGNGDGSIGFRYGGDSSKPPLTTCSEQEFLELYHPADKIRLYDIVCYDQRTKVKEILGQKLMWAHLDVGYGKTRSNERDEHNHKTIKDIMKEKYPEYTCWEHDCGLWQFGIYTPERGERWDKTVHSQEIAEREK